MIRWFKRKYNYNEQLVYIIRRDKKRNLILIEKVEGGKRLFVQPHLVTR